MTDDLASGFQSVDRAPEFALFSGCLDLIDSLPFSLSASARVMTCLAPLPGAEYWRSVVDSGTTPSASERGGSWAPCLRVSRG
jgi:hypothetical protein